VNHRLNYLLLTTKVICNRLPVGKTINNNIYGNDGHPTIYRIFNNFHADRGHLPTYNQEMLSCEGRQHHTTSLAYSCHHRHPSTSDGIVRMVTHRKPNVTSTKVPLQKLEPHRVKIVNYRSLLLWVPVCSGKVKFLHLFLCIIFHFTPVTRRRVMLVHSKCLHVIGIGR